MPVRSETLGEGASVCTGVSWPGDDEQKLVRWGKALWSHVGDLCALTPLGAGCNFPHLVAFSDLSLP